MELLYSIGASLLVGLACFIVTYTFFQFLVKKYISIKHAYIAEYSGIFESQFIQVDIKRFAVIHLSLCLLFPALIYLLTQKFLLAIIVTVITFLGPKIHMARKQKQRLERLDIQIMNALGLIGNALKAGLTLPQAFENVCQQMAPPISDEFKLLLREYKLGISFDEALSNFAKRIPSTNADTFVSSILTSRKSGGDIAEVLEKMADSMKEIFRLEGKIDALTSQGKAQGLVLGGLPFFLGLVLYYLDKTMIVPLLTTPEGYAICCVIVLFWAIGIFFIWKIINVEV